MEIVKKKPQFDDSFIVNSTRKSGGLALFWKNYVRILDIEATNFYIAAHILDTGERYEWCFIGIYASPEDATRRMQWKELKSKVSGWGENG